MYPEPNLETSDTQSSEPPGMLALEPLMYSTVESVSQTTSETSLLLVRGRMFPDLMSSKLHEELDSCESNEYCELEKIATVCNC